MRGRVRVKAMGRKLKQACAALLLAAVLALCACAGEAEQYNNFLLDLDIMSRTEVAFAKVEREESVFFLKRDLDALREDIESVSWENETAAGITGALSGAARLLAESLEAREAGEEDVALALLGEAAASFEQARRMLVEFR